MTMASRSSSPSPVSHCQAAARRVSSSSGTRASAAAMAGATTPFRAWVEAPIAASAEPKCPSSARAASRPTPGVSSRRSHAENSSRSITCGAPTLRPEGAGTYRREASPGAGKRTRRSPGASLRLGETVAGRNRLFYREDERVRHPAEDAEHEQHAVALVGQLDLDLALLGRIVDDLAVAEQR